jgi:hypothetical protein
MDPAALQVLYHVLETRREGATDVVDLPGVDLRGAQLMRADLQGANLSGAGLDHTNLAGSKLGAAKLGDALLRWADLGGADLTGADLSGADLSWARVEGVSFADADLRGSALEGAVGEPSTVAGARIDRATCDRSRLDDDDVIQLWRAGVLIADIEAFSEAVQRACSPESAEVASDAGPPGRSLLDLERESRLFRLKQDQELPASARVQMDLEQLEHAVATGDSIPPISLRSLRLVAPTLTPDLIRGPSWRQGDRLLGVTLENELGRGNTGIVWKGVDDDGDELAVKLFDTARATEGLALTAYRRGVAIMNRLTAASVQGVMPLYAVSLNQLGFAMDYADNGSAVDLPTLRWQVKSVMAFFEQLCAIMVRAHEHGALHRCIKPANILLDADLNPLLTDFDMVDLPTVAAKQQDAGDYGAYAAPEELLGNGTQSPTADIYSLGRVLYFLLQGSHPEEKVADVPELETLTKQPAGLIRIIRKCTMRRPEARYQEVAELIADLERYEDYERVGVAGGASEANYLPHRVSALRHGKQWLRSPSSAAVPAPRASLRAASSARKRRDRGRSARSAEPVAAARFSRAHEKLIGTVGAFIVVGSVVMVQLQDVPTSALVAQMQILSAVGALLATLWVPRIGKQAVVVRAVLAIALTVVFYMLDLPGMVAPAGLAP